jgi:hypothetical protein
MESQFTDFCEDGDRTSVEIPVTDAVIHDRLHPPGTKHFRIRVRSFAATIFGNTGGLRIQVHSIIIVWTWCTKSLTLYPYPVLFPPTSGLRDGTFTVSVCESNISFQFTFVIYSGTSGQSSTWDAMKENDKRVECSEAGVRGQSRTNCGCKISVAIEAQSDTVLKRSL